jgi:hypothetical protein
MDCQDDSPMHNTRGNIELYEPALLQARRGQARSTSNCSNVIADDNHVLIKPRLPQSAGKKAAETRQLSPASSAPALRTSTDLHAW